MEKDYSMFRNFGIDELGIYLSSNALIILRNSGILTLENLFQCSDKDNFKDILKIASGKESNGIYNEIIGTVKILKCKYLNEDPMIDIYNIEHIDIRTDFGFSARAVNGLTRNDACPIEKLISMYEVDDFSDLYKIRNFGHITVKEVVTKLSIVYSYYKENNKTEDDLLSLFNELDELLAQNKNIMERIEVVKEKIYRRINSKTK